MFSRFAPAGTRRGGITNASATGFINAEGEFVSTAPNEGQRDTLYPKRSQPQLHLLQVLGLLTLDKRPARGASALDRINVVRLVIPTYVAN